MNEKVIDISELYEYKPKYDNDDPDINVQEHIVETESGNFYLSLALQNKLVLHPEIDEIPFQRKSGEIIMFEINDKMRERFDKRNLGIKW